jgi:ABC-type antimicrobial peptide transport system permease subunit
VRGKKILLLFLLKALFLAALGSIIGYFSGLFAAVAWQSASGWHGWLNVQWFLLALLVATILSLTASWIPAYIASQQDPADILRME